MNHHISVRVCGLLALSAVLTGCSTLPVEHTATAPPVAPPSASARVSDGEATSATDATIAQATVQAYLASLTEWDLGPDTDDLLAALTTNDREAKDRAMLTAQGVPGRSNVYRAAELGSPMREGETLVVSGCIEVRDGLGLGASEDVTWTLMPDSSSPTGWVVDNLVGAGTTESCLRTVS